jgi:ribosome-associated translation inhibitor RaiA
MQMKIQIKGLPRATNLRRVAAHKIDGALARYAHGIQEAIVRLDDINGPDRGGVDKLCRVVLKMKDSSILVIEELAADITQAIERVADRLHQSVARKMFRIVGIDRNGIRPRLAAGLF